MIILGFDPGLARIGYGLVSKADRRVSFRAAGLITTPASQPFAQRLVRIHREVRRLIRKYRPDLVGIERLFFFKNAKTAFSVGQAWGVITFTVTSEHLPIIEFTPLQIKQMVTGYGQADKAQVQKMLKTLFRLKAAPKQDDVADALACAYCAAVFSKTASGFPLTK